MACFVASNVYEVVTSNVFALPLIRRSITENTETNGSHGLGHLRTFWTVPSVVSVMSVVMLLMHGAKWRSHWLARYAARNENFVLVCREPHNGPGAPRARPPERPAFAPQAISLEVSR